MLEIILKKLEAIETNIKEINKRVSIIEDRLKNMEDISSRMDNHISFIEIVYNKLKSPLTYLMGTRLPLVVDYYEEEEVLNITEEDIE